MNQNQRSILPLFATPIYINNVGDFQKPDMGSVEFTSGAYSFLTSVDKCILDRQDFAVIRDVVLKEVGIYAHEILAVNAGVEFYITNSWINVHKRGHAAGAHIHHNSLISGVLYLQVNENSGDLVFHRDVLSLIPFPPTVDLDMDSFNIYNCKSWGHKPKTNDICLFPSVVSHSADPNQSDEDRWCLAFNTFVRGDIGKLHKLAIR